MSELFDSLNVKQRASSSRSAIVEIAPSASPPTDVRRYARKAISASRVPDAFPVTSTPPFCSRRQNTSAPQVSLHAAFDTTVSPIDEAYDRQGSLSPSSNDEDQQKRQADAPQIVWHAPPSPSLQVQQAEHTRLMARALGQRPPMASQAFRDELLRAREEHLLSTTVGNSISTPTTKASTPSTAFNALKRRQSKRNARRSYGGSSAKFDRPLSCDRVSNDLTMLESFMQDLDKRSLDQVSLPVQIFEDDDKENVQHALIQGMDRAFSQEEFLSCSPTFDCLVAVAGKGQQNSAANRSKLDRKAEAWSRTTSMPSQAAIQERMQRLGKREYPNSPADGAKLASGIEKGVCDAGNDAEKGDNLCLNDGSPHKRSALASVSHRPFARTTSEQHNRLRRPVNVQGMPNRAPRVGLSRSASVAVANGHTYEASQCTSHTTSAVKPPPALPTIKAPFKQPTRRSPRKHAAAFVSTSRSNSHIDKDVVGNNSFDDDIDEIALCRALDEIEASQSLSATTEEANRSASKPLVTQKSTPIPEQQSSAPLPQSDDSFEASIDEDVSAAILSQLDAQGW